MKNKETAWNLTDKRITHICFPVNFLKLKSPYMAAGNVLQMKLFLKFLQNSEENTSVGVSYLT